MKWQLEKGTTPRRSSIKSAFGVICLFIPLIVPGITMLREGDTPQPLLAGGVACLLFMALAILQRVGATRAFNYRFCSPLYLIAVLILWVTSRDASGWFINAAMATLLCFPLVLFVGQEYMVTGRASLRRARALVRRVAAMTEWPPTLEECKALPIVKALRDALRDDAEPGMVLLMHPKAEVRIAILAALEYRPGWAKGQAETVLKALHVATEDAVRIAAMMALANVDDPALESTMALYLRDTCKEVRIATAEALLWDAERRWPHIHREIRSALSEYRCHHDGPLPFAGPLPRVAVDELVMWSSEAGSLGMRSTLTLQNHYRRELSENPTPELVDEVASRISDTQIASALRVELAYLLTDADCAPPAFWLPFLAPGEPSALRLLAAGALLQTEAREEAMETLREVGRVPNREMALQVAAIVQKHLRIDMGLPLGGPLPESKGKLAAEIATRVIEWATGKPVDTEAAPPPRRTRSSNLARQIPRPGGEAPLNRV